MELRFQKRSVLEWSAIILLALPFVYSFLEELIMLPGVIRFASDFIIICLSGIILSKSLSGGRLFVPKISTGLSILVIVFLMYTFIGYLFNFQNPLYYIWGVRNNFRFYLAFFIFVSYLNEETAQGCLKFLDFAFWVNCLVMLVQYFVFGYNQDFLGGLFGVTKGCNGYMLIFFCIVITKSLLSYMNGNQKFWVCMVYCTVALMLSALAELKIVFVLFFLILIIAACITKFSAKKVLLMASCFFALIVAYTLLVMLFESFRGFLSINNLLNELTKENYASSEDMGRFTSISFISNRFLTSFWERLVGMGLGNCEVSAIPMFNTEFYNQFARTHYSIFSVSFVFIEMGFIGLTFFTSFFIITLVQSVKAFKQKKGNLLFNQMGILLSLLCFIIMFYNSSLRTEAGYMMYFVLALPFIGLRNQKYERERVII